MASLIEELINVLEETTGCYEDLLIVANNKKEVIIKGNVPSLQTLTDEEQGVAGHLLRLEKKRTEIINDVCLVTNKDPETMTISSLIDLLAKQENEQTKLHQVSEDMITIVNEVKKVNDLNKSLLNESIDYVNFTMNAIQSSASLPQGNSYQKKGNLYDTEQGNNFFDAKQ
jgi:flagellar biosynthesis/type III secretory pathway chaperone